MWEKLRKQKQVEHFLAAAYPLRVGAPVHRLSLRVEVKSQLSAHNKSIKIVM